MPGEEDEEENNVATMSRKRRWPGRIKGAVLVLELFLKKYLPLYFEPNVQLPLPHIGRGGQG